MEAQRCWLSEMDGNASGRCPQEYGALLLLFCSLYLGAAVFVVFVHVPVAGNVRACVPLREFGGVCVCLCLDVAASTLLVVDVRLLSGRSLWLPLWLRSLSSCSANLIRDCQPCWI